MKSAVSTRRHFNHNVEYLLVDGYNIIFVWGKLRKIAEYSLESARDTLISSLQNYKGVAKKEIIVVFDAHKVSGGKGTVTHSGGISIVYTQEAETADAYIEKSSRHMSRDYLVSVATSDNLEQVIIMGSGAVRISANELIEDVLAAEKEIRRQIDVINPIKNNQLLDNLDPETAKWFDAMRNG